MQADERQANEHAPLLPAGSGIDYSAVGSVGAETRINPPQGEEEELTRKQRWKLYISHFLSTWNARGYEFAAILFTASAYPETLTASSIRGILTNISTLTLSSAVGRWCDANPSRLDALRTTIFSQRICVVLACIGWIFIVGADFVGGKGFILEVVRKKPRSIEEIWWAKGAVTAAVMVLGIGERLSAIGNMIVMERGIVPILATRKSLPGLNASMRRIDLICKLLSPVFISSIALVVGSMKYTAGVLAVMNATSVGVEWICARRVWDECGKLRVPRVKEAESNSTLENADEVQNDPAQGEETKNKIVSKWEWWVRGLRIYFGNEIWLPSLAFALLYVQLLSFSASMITYLLNAGFTLSLITFARTGSTLVEVSSTVIMPWGVKSLETSFERKRRPLGNPETPETQEKESGKAVEWVGFWGLWWMVVNLIPVTIILFFIPTSSSSITTSPDPLTTILLFFFLSLSRLGLWTYDLAEQTLVQTRVPDSTRGEFSGIEFSFKSAAELAQWIATAIWSSPDEFRYIASVGTGFVGVSTVAYTVWIWRRSGPLLDWEKLCSRRE